MRNPDSRWNNFLSITIFLLVFLGTWSVVTLYQTQGFTSLYFLCFTCGIGAVVLAIIRFLCGFKTKKVAAATLINLFFVECLFQVIGWLNLFPAGIDIAVFSVPYGRVIKNAEGPKNSDIMNRYGWHYPNSELKTDSRKIALIGDSFIEGLQIKAKYNVGELLENTLNSQGHKELYQVYSFGIGGSGPAQYYELLKHSVKYYNVKEAYIFIFLGNDLQNMAMMRPNGNIEDPKLRIQYIMGSDNKISLHPDSKKAVAAFNTHIDDNRKSMFINFPATVTSYLMTPAILRLILSKLVNKKDIEVPLETSRSPIINDMIAFGLSPFNYRPSNDPEVAKATVLAKEVLTMCKKFSDSNNVVLRFVTIPWFCGDFYNQGDTNTWSTTFDGIDLLQFEKHLVDWAKEEGVSLLPIGAFLKSKGLTVSEIKALYFASGKGHWTEKGHRFYAEAIYENIYKQP